MTSAEHINTTVKKVTSYSTIYSSNVENNLRLIDGGLDSSLSINNSCLTDWSDSFPYPNSVGVPDYCVGVIESLDMFVLELVERKLIFLMIWFPTG